jgi:Gpi18-like mannosyltransferase
VKVAKYVLLPTVVAKVLVWGSMLLWIGWGGSNMLLLRWLASFVHWDAVHYLFIAANGYPTSSDFHDAFLPGFPLAIRVVQLLVQDPSLSWVLVTSAGTFLALYFVYRWLELERGESEARLGVWLVALWPMALFLSLPYTEAPFMAAVAASIYYARKGDLGKAAVAGAVAALFRVFALALIPLLALQFWPKYKRTPAFALVLLPIVPVQLFFMYLRVRTGDSSAYFDAQASPSFNHHLDWPFNGMRSIWGSVFGGQTWSEAYTFGLELLFGIGGLVVCLALWLYRRFPRPLAAYCSAVWVMATSISFWLSVPRYELAMFPASLALVDAMRRWTGLRFPVFAVIGGATMVTAMVFASGWWIG